MYSGWLVQTWTCICCSNMNLLSPGRSGVEEGVGRVGVGGGGGGLEGVGGEGLGGVGVGEVEGVG